MSNSTLCRACEITIFVFVIIACMVFLNISSYQRAKHGPGANPLFLRLSSLTVDKFYITAEDKLEISWQAHLKVDNRKSRVNITISPFESFLTYKGIPISCGQMNETVSVGANQEKSLRIHHRTKSCEWERLFMVSPFASNLAIRMKKKTINMGMRMSMQTYYSHSIWGWDVWLQPYCKDFVIEMQGVTNEGGLMFNQTITCVVPSPTWYT